MTQCPVPAVPQPPALIVFPEMTFTDEQVAEFERQLAATLASPQKLVIMPSDPVTTEMPPRIDPQQFLDQFDDPGLRAPIYGPADPGGVAWFVRRWKYTLTLCLLLLASTGLLLAVQPRNWWVPSAFVAALAGLTWVSRWR